MGITDKRKVLLTGAAGRIGTAFRDDVGDRYNLRLAIRPGEAIRHAGKHEVIECDIANLESCQEACAGIDTVVHLAGDPHPGAHFYGSLLENNIKGTYNIFRAAKESGCRRVIFASSAHVVKGYPPDVQVSPEMPVRPHTMYGVSKCFGEAIAAYFATAEQLPSIVIRIGWFEKDELRHHLNTDILSSFISRRDMTHLLVRCIETRDVQFAIVYGISNNRFKRYDLTATRELLNYQPQDDAFTVFNVELPPS